MRNLHRLSGVIHVVSGVPQGSGLELFMSLFAIHSILTVYLKQLRAYFFFVDNL